MNIKAKHLIMLGAFIVMAIIGYQMLPREEILIQAEEGVEGINNIENSSGDAEEMIYVHIEGAVYFPGIKEIPKGTRLFEAIEISGGTTSDADISKVNLASVLKDEQKIYIPFIVTEEIQTLDSNYENPNIDYGAINYDNQNNYDYININYATAEELQKLDGIGASIAKAIISYREENGYFSSIEEIKEVSGIGEAKFEKIKERISI